MTDQLIAVDLTDAIQIMADVSLADPGLHYVWLVATANCAGDTVKLPMATAMATVAVLPESVTRLALEEAIATVSPMTVPTWLWPQSRVYVRYMSYDGGHVGPGRVISVDPDQNTVTVETWFDKLDGTTHSHQIMTFPQAADGKWMIDSTSKDLPQYISQQFLHPYNSRQGAGYRMKKSSEQLRAAFKAATAASWTHISLPTLDAAMVEVETCLADFRVKAADCEKAPNL